jgi:hypothetical protein
MRQNIARVGAALVCAGAVTSVSVARAQEAPYSEQRVAAPANAFELKVNAGYTQGFGMIAPGRSIPDVAGAGFGVGVDADYRGNPTWSVGVQGEYQEFASRPLDTAARGLAGNIGATYHAMPFLRGDPYLRLGTGYRLLWQVNPPGAPTALLHGFELAKATIGYDVRVSSDVALAPQVGADLNLFVWQNQNGTNSALSTAQVGTFIFAGLQGRFDMGGTKVGETEVAKR